MKQNVHPPSVASKRPALAGFVTRAEKSIVCGDVEFGDAAEAL